MKYKVLLHPKVDAFLKDTNSDLRDRIKEKLHQLDTNPEKGKRLKHSNFWKIRIGEHRAIYEINHKDKQVIILYIGHRKNVYDDFSRLF